uniref:Uncharacterized protein n=1 Tax=Leersia perrieri TaxID=77586 RepID=A0A0D9XGM6_9ORYZ
MNNRDMAIVEGHLTLVRLCTCHCSDFGWCLPAWDLWLSAHGVNRRIREDLMFDSCDLEVDEHTRNIELLPRLPDRPPMAKLIGSSHYQLY